MEVSASVVCMIIVLAFLAFFVFRGHKKGFLKAALSTFSFVIVIIVSTALSSPVSNLIENTKAGSSIESTVSGFIETEIEEFTGGSGSVAETDETSFLESLPLPSFMQKLLKSSNTLEEYAELQVENFEEYACAKVSDIIISAVSYVIVMIIACILIKIILKAAKFVNKIPVIGGLNKFLGALLGLFEGLLILWAAGLVIITFSQTSFGRSCVELIQANALLNFIFDNNLLVVLLGLQL